MTEPSELYAQLVSAFGLKKWLEARSLVEKLLPFAAEHAGVYGIAGLVSMELHQLPEAVAYLQKATTIDPARADFATLHAKALALSQLTGEALLAADRAMKLAAGDHVTLDTLGVIYAQSHAVERAVEAFQQAVALEPERASYRFNLANALIATGQLDWAEDELERCIALNPAFGRAHLHLARLRRQTPDRNHVQRLQALLDRTTGTSDATTTLNMALAREYEDLGDYARSFNHLLRGKNAGRARRRHSIKRDELMFDTLMRLFPAGHPHIAQGDPSNEPIFVMGLPRTGTTLVERILSSHPQVHAAGELQNFAATLQKILGSATPALFDPRIFDRIRDIDWRRLGKEYLQSTRPGTAQKPRFIDKLPHNFLYAGFIARALPNAKLICLRRDPLDSCLSNFRHLSEHPSCHFDYSFDLMDTGRYFVLFDHLMAHWQQALPGRIHEVNYEALIDSQEVSSRRLLEFCGLPWDDACLSFERNTAPVSTASAVQVRAPLYRTAIQRWKHYENELADLRRALLAAGIRLDVD